MYRDLLFFLILHFVIGMCPSVIYVGYFIIVEADCNWYLYFILIYSLCPKKN
jgi:hypothetical protein